jgi:hypothetical protein
MSALTRLMFKLVLATSAGAAMTVPAAQAADNIRYVSVTGKDSNACTLAAPCRALQRAINVAPAGGEVRVLDSGSYGDTARITKSLTISGYGHIVYLGSRIDVDAAAAVVVLRGLVLNGLGDASNGIRIVAAAAVHIERCTIHGFFEGGIEATAPGLRLFVIDTVSRDNRGHGITVAELARLTVDNSRFENNGQSGIGVSASHASISRSTVSGNAVHGISALRSSVSVMSTVAAHNVSNGFFIASGTALTVDTALANGNGGAGLRVEVGSTARISSSTFTRNATGVSNAGLLETQVNNTIRGNGTDVVGTRTAVGGL